MMPVTKDHILYDSIDLKCPEQAESIEAERDPRLPRLKKELQNDSNGHMVLPGLRKMLKVACADGCNSVNILNIIDCAFNWVNGVIISQESCCTCHTG
jgi:hypothetical protein